ncbi:hypothetical protein PCC8801_1994 [Rippkaea orientalis PCC 8801]|uniref:Uncharacterized protein n=1 Tax=Rippkaea orientalis (strain PCC 8801 / RF-1) TaxID=41431 RepID=B7JYV5_RIPO1|nr:hypothetical protein [Rippkaea orientalis]ACK66032.1 hypothetical protein PCC8801_1994 [Rippkaea orientalis PCC 8801]
MSHAESQSATGDKGRGYFGVILVMGLILMVLAWGLSLLSWYS